MIGFIRKEGGSRVLAVSKYLPPEWKVVDIGVVKKSHNCITIKIEKVR